MKFLRLLGLACLSLFPLLGSAENCLNDLHIALDIGHSPAKPGAISARGIGEYHYNQRIVQRLREALREQGAEHVYVLSAQNPEMPLHARASLANARKVDILLSIHHDSVQPHYLNQWEYEGESQHYSDKFSGHSLFISSKNPHPEQSLRLARALGEQFRALGLQPTFHHAEAIPGENKPLLDAQYGIYQYDDLVILKRSKMPAVLLECGVIVNRQEEQQLADPAYQQQLVAAVLKGLAHYCSAPTAQKK